MLYTCIISWLYFLLFVAIAIYRYACRPALCLMFYAAGQPDADKKRCNPCQRGYVANFEAANQLAGSFSFSAFQYLYFFFFFIFLAFLLAFLRLSHVLASARHIE